MKANLTASSASETRVSKVESEAEIWLIAFLNFMNRIYFFRTILDLLKNGADSPESSHITPPTPTVSPIIILHNIVHLLQLMKQYWYIITKESP